MTTFQGKILTAAEMRAERDRLHAAGRKLVFTNGCFDILHAGHVTYLAFAREQGDALCVGLNSDASVQRNKGPLRPVVDERNRATLLASLRAVDRLPPRRNVRVWPSNSSALASGMPLLARPPTTSRRPSASSALAASVRAWRNRLPTAVNACVAGS